MRAGPSRRVVAVVATVGAVAAVTAAAPATAQQHRHRAPAVAVVAKGLNGPYGIAATGHRGFVVAEGDAGQVTQIGRHGSKRVLISGAPGVAGVAVHGRRLFAVLGGGNETGTPPEGDFPATSVVRADLRGHHARAIANLQDYELAHNPDGQVQFGPDGTPYDALSNPFSMNYSRFGLLVADGGANDVLKVNPRTGRVSTFFVPPTVKDVAACLADGAQANPGTVGCDPVPTGIAVRRGSVYVSTLGAEVPGAGRVYQLNGRTGRVQHVWKGLTAPTGIAVSPRGTVFVSEVLFNAPEGDGPPPPGFDPASVGRITRISHGRMTHAAVPMPTGMTWRHGQLYSTAWSIAGQVGIPDAGQVVRVSQRAFH